MLESPKIKKVYLKYAVITNIELLIINMLKIKKELNKLKTSIRLEIPWQGAERIELPSKVLEYFVQF